MCHRPEARRKRRGFWAIPVNMVKKKAVRNVMCTNIIQWRSVLWSGRGGEPPLKVGAEVVSGEREKWNDKGVEGGEG